MAKRQSQQIPLVIYKGGKRYEIGKAIVGDDGSILAQVEKDHWPMVKDLFKINVGELSIAPVRTSATPYHGTVRVITDPQI